MCVCLYIFYINKIISGKFGAPLLEIPMIMIFRVCYLPHVYVLFLYFS